MQPSGRRHLNTCQWLLIAEEYEKWLDKDHFDQYRGFLWITAKPGAGQSNTKDRQDRTALHFAILFNRPPIIKLLIAAGAEIDARDAEGLTPLHYCVMEPWATDSPTITEILLDAGADLQSRDNRGRTPLMFAIDCSSSGPIRFLLEKGACLESRNSSEEESIVYSGMGDNNTNGNGLYPITGNIEAKDTNGKTLLHRCQPKPAVFNEGIIVSGVPFPQRRVRKISPVIRDRNAQWPGIMAAARSDGVLEA
jgi:hypothetical protein